MGVKRFQLEVRLIDELSQRLLRLLPVYQEGHHACGNLCRGVSDVGKGEMGKLGQVLRGILALLFGAQCLHLCGDGAHGHRNGNT